MSRGEIIENYLICRPSINIFKHLWLSFKKSYGDSLGCRKESLFKWPWSHGQDGHLAYIVKTYKKSPYQEEDDLWICPSSKQFRRMAENGFAPPPPPLGNFADISYLVEN